MRTSRDSDSYHIMESRLSDFSAEMQTHPSLFGAEPLQPRHGSMRNTLLRATVTILAFWGLVDILSHTSHQASLLLVAAPSNDAPPCWCGTSNQEAIAMGCIYDHIAVDWLPAHCHDADLVAEFDASGPAPPNGTWPYYRAKSHGMLGTQFAPVDTTTAIDALARDGEDYWATVEWHVAHCLFTWRKQVRFEHDGERASVVEPWNSHEAHVRHCDKYIWNVIKNRRPLDEIDTIIPGKSRHVDE